MFNDTRGFLFNIKDNHNEDVLKTRKDLHSKLNDETEFDWNGTDLCNEIDTGRSLYSKNSCSMDILSFISDNELQDILPNLWVPIRIMM